MGSHTIQKTITLFRKAFEGLDLSIPLLQLEELAIMVHEAMSVQARSFHTPEHIFELSDGSNPIHALAALFHDVVYHEIDEGFTPNIEQVLGLYLDEGRGEIRLTENVSLDDMMFFLTLDVFGFEIGQPLLPSQGQNEFLSALLMNETLRSVVKPRDLVKTTVCIEATIPFRGLNAQGESPAEVLARRLRAINNDYGLGMSGDEIEEVVVWAVAFSNKDVENFSEQETGRFLDNTWKLLPESNPSLRHRGIYTIRSYRQALQRMEAFLSQLDPETVYLQYRDEPSPGDYDRMTALAHRNVHTGRQYLGLKLLAIGLLEALAAITGGDAPVALFMGGLDDQEDARRLEEFLPEVKPEPSVDESSTLFGLLAFGRASSSSFDLQNSPLSLFIFRSLGWERARALLDDAKLMFAGQLNAHTFLQRMPTDVVVPVAQACSVMASTRQAALRAYAESRR
ncbi:MAG: hypothetical protein ACP5HG_00700 [Anaerolineae bacterium]